MFIIKQTREATDMFNLQISKNDQLPNKAILASSVLSAEVYPCWSILLGITAPWRTSFNRGTNGSVALFRTQHWLNAIGTIDVLFTIGWLMMIDGIPNRPLYAPLFWPKGYDCSIRGTYFWICCFCINQHRVKEALQQISWPACCGGHDTDRKATCCPLLMLPPVFPCFSNVT